MRSVTGIQNSKTLVVVFITFVALINSQCSNEKKAEDKQKPMIDKVSKQALDMTSLGNFPEFIEDMHKENGMEAVISWVEQELVPGREIIIASMDEKEHHHIYDRSIWKLDKYNKPTSEAILEPLKDEDVFTSNLIRVSSFPYVETPFQIRIRAYYNDDE